MPKLTKAQKNEMQNWNVELNKILIPRVNINFTKLSYKELKELYEIFIMPGELMVRVGKYKGLGLLEQVIRSV